ncbi:MAG: futalosine hydrolase [Bacteroidia bacterium]|nr:futalosine hydrolase [Bacteroidia bacterium]
MNLRPNLLFVCATPLEATALSKDGSLKTGFYPDLLGTGKSLLITGVGLTATAYQLGKILSTTSFHGAVNFGVAGALDLSIPLGTAVEVITDEFADLGAENNDDFISLFEMNLQNENEVPFSHGKLVPMGEWKNIGNLRKVHGASVNTVHGNVHSIANFKKRSNAQIESMEGAAFFYACKMGGVDSLQIRAISNYVEPRNREHWKLEEAIQSLSIFLKQYFF